MWASLTEPLRGPSTKFTGGLSVPYYNPTVHFADTTPVEDLRSKSSTGVAKNVRTLLEVYLPSQGRLK